MDIPWIGLALGVVTAIANLCGGLAVVRRPWHPLYLRSFIALGSGFMLAASLLEMLPESYALLGSRIPTPRIRYSRSTGSGVR